MYALGPKVEKWIIDIKGRKVVPDDKMCPLKMNKCWLLSGAQYGLALVRVMSEDELKRDCFSPVLYSQILGSIHFNQINLLNKIK